MHQELAQATTRLRDLGASVDLRGQGAGTFLLASLGERGAELYPSGPRWTVDLAQGDELLGETDFDSIEAAIQATRDWLCAPR